MLRKRSKQKPYLQRKLYLLNSGYTSISIWKSRMWGRRKRWWCCDRCCRFSENQDIQARKFLDEFDGSEWEVMALFVIYNTNLKCCSVLPEEQCWHHKNKKWKTFFLFCFIFNKFSFSSNCIWDQFFDLLYSISIYSTTFALFCLTGVDNEGFHWACTLLVHAIPI